MGRSDESLFVASGSHDQDDRHTHIYGKTLQKPSPEPVKRFQRNLVCSIEETQAHHSLFK